MTRIGLDYDIKLKKGLECETISVKSISVSELQRFIVKLTISIFSILERF